MKTKCPIHPSYKGGFHPPRFCATMPGCICRQIWTHAQLTKHELPSRVQSGREKLGGTF